MSAIVPSAARPRKASAWPEGTIPSDSRAQSSFQATPAPASPSKP